MWQASCLRRPGRRSVGRAAGWRDSDEIVISPDVQRRNRFPDTKLTKAEPVIAIRFALLNAKLSLDNDIIDADIGALNADQTVTHLKIRHQMRWP